MIFRSKVHTIAENFLSRKIEESAVSDDAKNAFYAGDHFTKFVDLIHLQCNRLELKLGMLNFDGKAIKYFIERRVVFFQLA